VVSPSLFYLWLTRKDERALPFPLKRKREGGHTVEGLLDRLEKGRRDSRDGEGGRGGKGGEAAAIRKRGGGESDLPRISLRSARRVEEGKKRRIGVSPSRDADRRRRGESPRPWSTPVEKEEGRRGAGPASDDLETLGGKERSCSVLYPRPSPLPEKEEGRGEKSIEFWQTHW